MLRTHQLLKKKHGTTVICRHTSSQPLSDVRDWSCSQLWGWNKHHQRATPSIWNIPRLKARIPKGCWVTSVKVQRSDAIISWCKKDGTIWNFLYHSHPSQYMLQVGLTSPWNLFWFSSFSVTVDKNVNKLLCLESVTSAVPRIYLLRFPGSNTFSLCFCILQVIKAGGIEGLEMRLALLPHEVWLGAWRYIQYSLSLDHPPLTYTSQQE